MALLFVECLPQNNSRILRTVIKALELLVLSAGLISALVMVKGAVVPYSCEIVFSSLMGFFYSIKCFFSSSLYIWIIINFMFMLIAVCSSSIFHHRENDGQDDEIKVSFDHGLDLQVAELPIASSPPPAPPPPPPPRDITVVNEQENEEEDTLEATWKAITGEKEKPKKKHLKKSETWDVPLPPRPTAPAAAAVRRLDSEEVLPSTPKWKELRKSETFNDAVSITRRGGLRRDPSMSIDEFNKQVEAFIKKFNDDMRLQRQESDQRFLDMIGRRRL